MILLIARHELKRYFATPLAWVALAGAVLLLSWMLFTQLEIFLKVQPQLISKGSTMGLWTLVISPSLSMSTLSILLIAPLLGMGSISSELHSKRMSLYLSAPISSWQFVIGKWLGLFATVFLLLLLLMLAVVSIQSGSNIDWGKVFTASLGLLLLGGMTTAISIWLSSITKQPLLAGALAFSLLILLWLINSDNNNSMHILALNEHLNPFFQGLISSQNIWYFLAFILTSLALASMQIRILAGNVSNSIWQRHLFHFLLTVILLLSLSVSHHYNSSWDISHLQQNSLKDSSKKLFKQLQGKIHLTVFLADLPVQRGQVKQLIKKFQRHYPDIQLQFVDPAAQPEHSRKLGISSNGEMLIEYGQKYDKINPISEQGIINTLARLSIDSQGWILGLSGHGEADLFGQANFDLQNFNQLITKKGYRTINQQLDTTGQLPANTDLLIIAAPASDLPATELNKILMYLEQGGNLLWLAERSLAQPVADYFGLSLLPGTIVDAAAASLGIDTPTVAVASKHPKHEVNSSLNGPVLFPGATAMRIIDDNKGWSINPLMRTGPRSWNETDPVTGTVSQDLQKDEVRGPLDLAFAFSRTNNERQQKVIIIGDADFLSNAYLGNGANVDFGLAAIHWLTDNNQLVSTSAHTVDDLQYNRSAGSNAMIAFIFLLGIPLLLSALGLTRFYFRRKR